MVLGWLIRSMNTEIAQSILWHERATDVWKELKEHFSQADLFQISELQEEIYSLTQGDLSVTKYFTAMKILIDELEVLKPLPSCTCDALIKIKEERNSDHVIRFLRGLSEQFSGVRSQIMLMDPLPSINRVFQLAAQQERKFAVEHVPKVLMTNVNGSGASDSQKRSNNYHSGGTSGASSSRSSHGESSSGSSGYRGQGRQVCSYCGKIGHTVDVCYKKHGYPQSFKSKNASSQGHQKQVNLAIGADSGANTEDEDVVSSNGDHTRLTLIEAQYNKATYHISCTLSVFVSYKRIKPVLVNLPNGSSLTAHFSGTAVFTDSFYLIDDTKVSRMIGATKEVGGLYYLASPVLPTPRLSSSAQFLACLSTATAAQSSS
ncbi:uncharacterized protein LOC130732374 [Lotus japonicus]|uniref:uncharacterized protein LOC130732374 n=1 Tax=Lotus japonicus TaxID=34305 RepID=UPI002584DCCB|nr:uncharacterized protein LOC130732374 [Lotus japonicus]